ncbi:hypothetical protein ASE63_23170 [Bosea sp. Root381]|uniref:hypothetical protein n=1 Tax=Bosea sp. Root381 TaxID=1736524 RepID=UPI0006F8E5AC|nr:hypothetical protein [Bosea sp. Root381]KRE07149.1 hypothetical protein ASE63_23170 [Bosea sp. Root381]
MEEADRALSRLLANLREAPPLAIAVSGGVDSMTLASVAHRHSEVRPIMIHAVSPAVPSSARAVIDSHAATEGWDLTILDAGEQNDPRYRANPYNRCYFCKSNLYGTIRATTERTIASGTNLDDMAEHRPGLIAAGEHDVLHPFVAARIDKATIRAIARSLGLTQFAELPAQPCLASRIETGIAIVQRDLAFIDRTEREARACIGQDETVRVRLRRDGVHLEVGRVLAAGEQAALEAVMMRASAAEDRTFIGISPYRTGSAFVRNAGP